MGAKRERTHRTTSSLRSAERRGEPLEICFFVGVQAVRGVEGVVFWGEGKASRRQLRKRRREM